MDAAERARAPEGREPLSAREHVAAADAFPVLKRKEWKESQALTRLAVSVGRSMLWWIALGEVSSMRRFDLAKPRVRSAAMASLIGLAVALWIGLGCAGPKIL